MNTSLLTTLLVIATVSSAVSCSFIQKTKANIGKKWLIIYTIVVNMLIGVPFTLTFTDLSICDSLWVGLFSYLGADTLYKTLEGKLAQHSELIAKKVERIPRGDE
jgi:hypothetical protein